MVKGLGGGEPGGKAKGTAAKVVAVVGVLWKW